MIDTVKNDARPMPQGDGGIYRLLVEAITDYAVYMLDKDGFVISWNSGATRITGYESADVVGKHFSRFFTPEDLDVEVPGRAIATAALEGRYDIEGWSVRKDGTRFWSHLAIDPIRDPTGELIGYATITRDLTERKAAEVALKRSEEQFRLLVQSVTDYAIYMLDPDGHIVSWNTGAQKIKGYLPREIIGEHFSRFYTEEERQRGEPQRGLRIAAEHGRFEKEGWRVRKDGTQFWASVVIDAIRDEQGEHVGFAKITRDITEKKEAQDALEETREALFQSQKLESIGQLTGGVAHDFNNLLMVILSSLDLIRKRLPRDDSRLTSLVENAVQAAQRGASLTKRMLAFARRQEMDRKAVDLPKLVQGISELLQRSLGPSIQIKTRFPAALPKVYTDANQLETAILNLAVNARDAMPDGGPLLLSAQEDVIEAHHRTKLPSGRYVRFSVKDAGGGMDQETASRSIEPFFSTKGTGKGTGLGLPMVHGFAEQSGGRLAIRSEIGVGTTVDLWLPTAEAAEEEEQEKVPSSDDTDRGLQNLVVLAVDDDALVLTNTAAILEDLGHVVFEATSGQEALEVLKKEQVDVVVTDQAMPRMTGAQLAKRIEAERTDLPIVLATGYAELSDGVGHGLPRLAKPFTQKELAQAIDEALLQKGRKPQL
ncbi:hybrid sensor histidine kinase/response regulator [Chelativorans sp. YIM 93263]|uniref:hybrid sensor histidine kinase/response regulator n=1 Tax=Chelativorans sp. YIM 93263 TaxID=2906648 RepID=UPI00237A06C9|nr:PAS domain-containing sensor histidine kinase [Chelativorans sp. YIM 93263]